MLLVAAFTIMSISTFANDSTASCKCNLCGIALNLSPKEKMKWAEMNRYTCPMHPEIRSNKPGKCTKCADDTKPDTTYSCPNHSNGTTNHQGTCNLCGMALNLSPKEKMKWAEMKRYTCPIHPEIRSDKPGKCTRCNTELEEKKK